ncbi:MAG TPA: PleD family two-component system response regulator [Caulobacteraceae bacterium]|nr:PleD family two-component system response regulator [Caulobacteraceae bacterium]
MTARILVVDDLEANLRILKAKLEAEYYEVRTAADGESALKMAQDDPPDIVLLDVMMPGLDGFQVCRRLKGDPCTAHVPVVLVTALDSRADKIAGLEAGADDFLTKPIDDLMLFARVRSLSRLKIVIDELRQREASGRRLGVMGDADGRLAGSAGRVLIVDDDLDEARRLADDLAAEHRPVIETDPEKALLTARSPLDLAIVNTAASAFDGLRLGVQLRADEAARRAPILGVVDPKDRARVVKALEIGFNDIIAAPVDARELGARVKSLIRAKRYTEFLRGSLDNSLEMAVTDPLTGLHNRRYMTSQLAALVERAKLGGEPVAALMIDLDRFKQINDCFGHEIGDEVLREFAVRLASNVRAADLPCRFGGEEFIVIMPGTQLADAHRIAERIRTHVAGSPFRVAGSAEPLMVTISIGVAVTQGAVDSPEDLLKRADAGVYEAKAAGRNTVIAKAA